MLNIPYLVPGVSRGIWDVALRLYESERSSCRDKAGACSMAETSPGRSCLLPTYSLTLLRSLPPSPLGKRQTPMEDLKGMVKNRMAKIRPFSSLHIVLETLSKQTNPSLNAYQEKCKLGNALESV